MSRPRLDRRELLLIGVPTALVLAGAAFLARQQALREQDRCGPYRLAITRVELLPASSFETWQDYDTKIIVHAHDLGQLATPKGVQLSPLKQLEQNVKLVGQINGFSKSFPGASQDSGNRYEPEHSGVLRALLTPRSEELKDTVTFLANTSGFDPDAPLQLRGDLWMRRTATSTKPVAVSPLNWTLEKDGPLGQLCARSKAAPLVQPLERAVSLNTDRTPPPVEEVQSDLLSPVYAHTGVLGDNGSGIVHVLFPRGTLSGTLPELRSTAAQIFDARGRVVELKDASGSKVHKTFGWDKSTTPPTAVLRLPLENVPLDRGALQLKIWFAFNDGWPTCVQAEVRPSWMSHRPHTLQLQDVHVESGNVVVTAHYTGTYSLRYQGKVPLPGLTVPLLFDGRDDTRVFFKPYVNYNRLYTYWSQHYTLPDGKSYWFPNAVNKPSVSCDATNHCRITYKMNALQSLKPGQSARFFAQIGIQGEGFLPITATIARPKKLAESSNNKLRDVG